MQWSTKLFRIRGIDVRVHATFALIVALGATQWGARHGMGGAAFGAAFTLALFGCVLLHELGHSLVAQKFGLQVKEIILLPIGGIASLLGKPKHPGQEIAIALAGPAVNILLAGLFGVALWATGQSLGGAHALVANAKLPSLSTFLLLLTTGNLSLALFNLLPVFPLDGGRVLRALLELRWGAVRATVWAAGFGQIAALALGGYAIWSGQLFLAFIAAMIFMSAARETASTQLHGPLTQLRAEQLAEMPAVEFDALDRVRDAVPSLLRSAQTAFPVVSGGEVAGVVLRQDLIRAAEQPETGLLSIRTLMRQAPRLEAVWPVSVALHKLVQTGESVGVVMDGDHPLGLLEHAQVLSKLAQTPRVDWPKASASARNEREFRSSESPHVG